MNTERKKNFEREYNHLLAHYKHIQQNQINNWVRSLITSQTKHITQLIPNFTINGFYRARKHNILEGTEKKSEITKFTCESQFWNPPIDLCLKRGRCNDIHESLLYCSTEIFTAIIEVRPEKGEFVTIALFKPLEPEKYKGARVKFVGLKSLSKIPQLEHILGDDIEKDLEELELDEILDDLFHKKITPETEDLYRLSIAVTKSMMTTLYEPDEGVYYEIHGMLYPSIECNRESFNIIYKPEHAKLHFGISQLRTFKILESNSERIIVKEIRVAYQKPTPRMDPFDYYGFKWQNIDNPKTLELKLE
ncbi:hypothetical protein [Flavobacterium sp.]|uniref:hypothetical protein n=1 Tax=Flavobacterium sp. TaxID=239 RepID=UPI003266EE88